MKSLRHLSTISLLALATVLASAQDGGLGRGRGGGGGTGGGQSSPPPSRPTSPPPSSPPSAPAPSRNPGGNPSPPPSSQDSGLGRSRGGGTGGGQSSPPSSRPSLPPSNQGPSRNPGGNPSTGSGGRPSQDSGLGRDRGGSGSGSSGPSRDRGGQSAPPVTGGNGNSRGGSPDLSRTRYNNPGAGAQARTPYNTNSNVRVDRAPSVGGINVPPGIVRTDELALKARRQDNGAFGRGNNSGFNNNGFMWNGFRSGYCHYNTGWQDNFFFYPNYCMNPWQSGININVVVSPWYLYPFLPGYLYCNTVVVTNYRSPWFWNTGVVYQYDNRGWDNRWDWSGNNSNRNIDVDNSLEDLRDSFERYDRRSLSRLIPQRGQVAILRDNRYDYSMNADEFYDLLNDLAGNAQDSRYVIEEIRTNRNSARVVARHDYVDPWGRRQSVYHSMYLESERRGQMVIREFGTSDRRPW